MNKKLYEVLKWVALIGLPALAFLVVGLNGIWDIPDQDRIVATITLADTFLGLLLKLRTPIDGTVQVIPGAELDDPEKFDIDLRKYLEDPALVENQKILRLAVTKKDRPPAV